MKFYCELPLGDKELAFEIEADSAHEAFRLVAAFQVGLIFGGVTHGDIARLGREKKRGTEYRRLV